MTTHVLLHPTFIDHPPTPQQEAFCKVVEADVDGLSEAAKHYGESWFQREGAGAFFMLARKWDRIEKKMKDEKYKSILEVLKADPRAEGMIDDIRDLRRYLILVEAKLIELGHLHGEVTKGAAAPVAVASPLAVCSLCGAIEGFTHRPGCENADGCPSCGELKGATHKPGCIFTGTV